MTWIKRIGILLTWLVVLVGGALALISSQSVREKRPLKAMKYAFKTLIIKHF